MCMCVLMLTNDNNITQNNKQTNRQKRMIKSKKKIKKIHEAIEFIDCF